MAGKIALDTNVAIDCLSNRPSTLRRLEVQEKVFVPVIVLDELFHGALNSQRSHSNLERIEELLDRVAILSCSAVTALWYGRVKTHLRAKGRPIPENDIWIASLCIEHNLPLATRDAHFNEIPDLAVEAW